MNKFCETILGLTVATLLFGCADEQPPLEQVDFVGCPADGQVGEVAPPQGEPKNAVLDGVSPDSIAFYKGERAAGAFAPSGWHCRVWYGSSGSTLIVTPEPIEGAQSQLPKFSTPAVEVASILGGTSGRFSVAAYASRLFPLPAALFIQKVKDEGAVPDSDLGAYPNDSVSILSNLVVEFKTPANTRGVGTDGALDPSGDPISGLAVLDESKPEEPNISIVRIRLGPTKEKMGRLLLRLNTECMLKTNTC